MVRKFGDGTKARMRLGGRDVSPEPKATSPSSQPEAGNERRQEATVVAAVPVLRPSENDRNILRFVQAGLVSVLRVLSEARVDSDELAERLGDEVKSHVDAANWAVSKMREEQR